MADSAQIKIPALYMRGGTSKGLFFALQDLPSWAQQPGPLRDALLLRVIGSPDPYGKHTDGMGGATSSTSKVVIVSKSSRVNHDVDYLFGQVSIDKPFIDWSGNCGNLTAAVGSFAIEKQLVDLSDSLENGQMPVRIWQANIQKTIVVKVPVSDGVVQELGDFELDGVAFPAAEIAVEFLDPADGEGALFPTGNLQDDLEVPEDIVPGGRLKATLISAGIPTVFVSASDLGLTGTELQEDINSSPGWLEKFEILRAIGAVKMGLIATHDEAAQRQHTPKIAFIGSAQDYVASSGKPVLAKDIDLVVRALSMGKLHHAMMGTAAVSIAAAAVVPGTLVNDVIGQKTIRSVRFGHPSGTLKVGAKANLNNGKWQVEKVVMSRSVRILMEGVVRVPTPPIG